jgi:outer membrane lipoprotein-sorting protein
MRLLKPFLLTCTIALSACGETEVLTTNLQQQMPQQSILQPQNAALPVSQPMANLKKQMEPVSQAPAGKNLKPAANGKAPETQKTVAKTPVTTALSTEEKILKKAKDSFEALQTISASIKTFETGNNGIAGSGQLKFIFKKPSNVKVDIISSTASGQTGVKLSYSTASEVHVRPSGVLSMVSVDLSMNDDKLLSGRKYQMNQIDLPGTITRLTQPGLKVKLIGQTTVSGSLVFILEIIPAKHFDPRITREVLGIDSKTFMPRMHEMYEGGKKVYAVELTTININTAISAEDFNV